MGRLFVKTDKRSRLNVKPIRKEFEDFDHKHKDVTLKGKQITRKNKRTPQKRKYYGDVDDDDDD